MEQGYSLSNIFNNTTRKQRIGFGIIVVVIIVLLVILVVLVMNSSQDDSVNDEEGQQADGVVDVTEDTYVDDQGYTVTQETTTYADGGKVITETKMDEYGNVTTVDPSLITTYFPYQVVRKHTSEDLIDAGFDSTLRYSLHLDEESKTINAMIEDCDVEGDKALVEQYISSIPLDLSAYTVNYETFSEDAFCE